MSKTTVPDAIRMYSAAKEKNPEELAALLQQDEMLESYRLAISDARTKPEILRELLDHPSARQSPRYCDVLAGTFWAFASLSDTEPAVLKMIFKPLKKDKKRNTSMLSQMFNYTAEFSTQWNPAALKLLVSKGGADIDEAYKHQKKKLKGQIDNVDKKAKTLRQLKKQMS